MRLILTAAVIALVAPAYGAEPVTPESAVAELSRLRCFAVSPLIVADNDRGTIYYDDGTTKPTAGANLEQFPEGMVLFHIVGTHMANGSPTQTSYTFFVRVEGELGGIAVMLSYMRSLRPREVLPPPVVVPR